MYASREFVWVSERIVWTENLRVDLADPTGVFVSGRCVFFLITPKIDLCNMDFNGESAQLLTACRCELEVALRSSLLITAE
jgi:hypothetical protein